MAYPRSLCAFLVLALLGGCQSAYYSTMEKFGFEKRDILVDRVEEARDAQVETKETFRDTLEEFSALIDYDGGDLEQLYDRLRDGLEDSEEAAEGIGSRIESVASVASDLFAEWEEELEQYTRASLRRASADQLDQLRERYEELIAAMRQAESRIEPVLGKFRDQVLFLKHNLNARAVASLDAETRSIQNDVETLIEEMEDAIAEADAFIAAMQ